MKALFGRGASRKALSALGVVAAVAVTLNVNLLASRFYRRWDVTSEGWYTLSEATQATLQGLREPVDVVVLLSRSDPLGQSLKHLLAAYRAVSPKLSFRELDPDQNPAEFSAIQQKYGILAGQTEDGEAYTDASVVITQGGRHWFVTADALVRIEPDGEHVRPALEQALTEGIVSVLGHSRTTLCFSRGHREQGLHDTGLEGLSELRTRLEKNNYLIEERDLGGERAESPLEGCRVLVIAGPRLPFDPASGASIAAAVAQKRLGVLALVSPIVGEAGRVVPSGLEALAELAGAELGKNLILETEPKRRAPRGIGEVFFATPEPHAVTRGLTRGGAEPLFDVVVTEAQSVRSLGQANVLLRTSDRAVALDDLRPVLAHQSDTAIEARKLERFSLAVARELSGDAASPARVVLVGSATPAQNRSFRDSALYGDRLFVENAVAWLSARQAVVSVPEKPARELGLSLSEDSLSDILRYVMIYMPATAGLLGVFVLLRRRSLETRSRRGAAKPAEDTDAPRP